MRRFLFLMTLASLVANTQQAHAQFIAEVLGDNPVGFWVLNDVGPSAIDSVSGFNGTYGAGTTPQGIAGPSWVPGSGQVANFTGGSISFTSALNLGPNGYTIQAWINPTFFSVTNRTRVVASGAGLNGYGFGTDAGGRLIFTSYGQQDYVTTVPSLLPNQWQYVGVVLDTNNDAHFYRNGAFLETVSSIMGPTSVTSSLFTIGNESPGLGPDEFFFGGIAGVSVYNTALTAGQIQDQYNAATVPEPTSFALLAFAAMGAARVWQQRRPNAGSTV